jgi:hypothetical protein
MEQREQARSTDQRRNAWRSSAITGIGGIARRTLAWLAGGMGLAASVVETTEPGMLTHALFVSDPDARLRNAAREQEYLHQEPRRTRTLQDGKKRKLGEEDDIPRFKRGFVWAGTHRTTSPSALATETASPLPSPPQHLLDDPVILTALETYKDAIKVDTPFDVDRFEKLLASHPNRPFVKSVIKGLREGFWPLDEGDWKLEAEEIIGNYSDDSRDLDAIRQFRDRELAASRWSEEVECGVPGTKVSPMFVVWQNEKPRVVTDHSASGLNDGIPRADAKVSYDNLRTFGDCMNQAKQDNPGRRLILFKSDIATAFLNLPAHPIWQIQQLVVVDGKLYLVRRLVFRSRASPRIWCAVSGLLCWIGAFKLGVVDLHVYMDDFFGWDFADNLVMFRNTLRPKCQVQILLLWEAIGCPFEDRKQLSGSPLKIIGFWVDINNGTISLCPDSVDAITKKISFFLDTADRKPPLRDWLRLSGHLNWLLNVLPWGRPALTELYRKISAKTQMYRNIFINAEVRRDLSWLSETIPASIGIRFIDAGLWKDHNADMVFWTDASLKYALSFVFAGNGFFYPLRKCPTHAKIDIFFLELIAIMSAINYATRLQAPPQQILIWSDSFDSVCAFHSLKVSESLHNGPLLGVASIILRSGVDVRVRHIPGEDNIRADLLSRLMFEEFHRRFPSYRVRKFEPPRELLPARWRECF